MQKITNLMLPIAMVIGIIFYQWILPLAPLMPYLLFLMLLFTFMRISPRDFKFEMLHLWLLIIQLVGAITIYWALYYFDIELAQGALICVLAPTATSSAVITGILGGSVSFITGYVIVSNVAVSLAAPIIFSFIGNNRGLPFFESVTNIAGEVLPILVAPLLLAWIVRWGAPKLKDTIIRFSKVTLYMWAFSLTLVTARTVGFVVSQDSSEYSSIVVITLVTMVICVGQFWIGRYLGGRYGDKISGGQGLGQKNTILAIWMSHIYLNPLASIAPSAYILWQNIINSYQIWKKGNN